MENVDWAVYPAIDLRRGRVVRLMQGDPNQETKYADEPLSVARLWQEAGAEWLHIVNLDGAFGERSQENQAALERILTTGLQVQFGGGLRNLESIRRALESPRGFLGVRRRLHLSWSAAFDHGSCPKRWLLNRLCHRSDLSGAGRACLWVRNVLGRVCERRS